MKTAIYIEDGVVQLVLTPESSFERNAISSLSGKKVMTTIHEGSFYYCQGGWFRQGNDPERSLIIKSVPAPA